MSDYPTAANQHRTTRILNVKNETPTVRTFTFKDKICGKAEPGQFVMLWIPGVDEIPLSVLDAEANGTVSVAVKKVGEATSALHGKKVGDFIGVRGPLGNSFTVAKARILMVAGGTGAAPLSFFVKRALPRVKKLVFLLGAKTESELLFMDELKARLGRSNAKLIVSTEDGTCGITGLCTDTLEQLLKNEKFDMIYACGPEQMLLKVFELAEKNGARVEVSLERLMRCAIGLCGSCALGKYRVCTDGPVFTSEQLREVKSEFGVFRRDFDGKKIKL